MRGSRWPVRRLLLGLMLFVGVAAGVWSNAAGANAQSGLPHAPDIHTITALHGGLRVYWWAPARDGGSAIAGYEVQYRAGGTTTWTDAGHSGLAQPAVIGGLRFNANYDVRVRAVNANGKGSWSLVDSSRTARDDGRPDPPLPPTLTAGDGEIAVSWNAPAYTGAGPLTGYRVRYTTDDGDTWRTWSVGGSRLITGTSTTITGLDNGVLTGVVLAALNNRGQSTNSAHTAEAVPVGPLSLTLVSSRELCTANTLTELSWTITGGVPPYTLTIEGQQVDASAESHRVNCGPLQIDSQTEEPLPNQSKTFQTVAADSRGVTTNAEMRIGLAPSLPTTAQIEHLVYGLPIIIRWAEVVVPSDTAGEDEFVRFYLLRRRDSDMTTTYQQIERKRRYPLVFAEFRKLPPGKLYQYQVASMRVPLEAETPDALSWTTLQEFTTLTTPTGLIAEATHDTVTVRWNDQPSATGWSVRLEGPDGERTLAAEGGDNHVTFRGVTPAGRYRAVVELSQIRDACCPSEVPLEAEVRVETEAAPADYSAPLRGPQNVQASATATTITVRWDAPHEHAGPTYLVHIFRDDEPDHPIDGRWLDESDIPVTFHELTPDTDYLVNIIHIDIVEGDFSTGVTTNPPSLTPGGSRSRRAPIGGEIPEVPTEPIDFAWPLAYNPQHILTADLWVWRDNRYHAGLVIGHEQGGERIRNTQVLASGAGRARAFNVDHSQMRQIVWYCPQLAVPFPLKFTYHG